MSVRGYLANPCLAFLCQVLPYENAKPTAQALARFIAANWMDVTPTDHGNQNKGYSIQG